MASLHTEFTNAVRVVRDTLGAANVGHFTLTISAEGRTETGADNVRIEYVLGDGRYGESVKGDSIKACLAEMLRRKGWQAEHAPLCLVDARPSRVDA